MELIYTITRKPCHTRDWKQDETSLCRISCSNIVAFCSTVQLDKTESSKESIGCQYRIYVCDIDKPWQVHLVVSCKTKVVALEWHVSGTKLLIATVLGKCQIWQMQNYLLNHWELEASADLPGEEIIALAWFSQGSKSVLNGDKKESVQYFEKVSRIRTTPTVSQFGGRPLDGWVAVTVSGLVAVGMLTGGSKEMPVTMKSLTPGRLCLSLVDVAFDPKGHLGIVTSDGLITSAIQCYTVKICDDNNDIGLEISCDPAPSFYIHCHREQAYRDNTAAKVTHVKYMQRDATDVLMVAAGDAKMSHIERWYLVTEFVNLHPLYHQQVAGKPDTQFQRQSWSFFSSIQHGSLPLSIATPKFPISYHITDVTNEMFQYVAVSYKDGSVKLISKTNFQPMLTTNLDMGWSDMGSAEKRRRVIAHLSSMEQTLTGCVLAGIDQLGTMYAMKVVNTRDPVTHVSPLYLVGLLEYAITVGYDWWDILVVLKQNALDVCEKLQDNFNKQASVLQELLFSRFMAVKGTLYRCASHHKAADTHCFLVLHCIRAHFNMILRPKGLSASEMGPIEKLSITCQKSSEADLDKFVVALGGERMDFAVDCSTLQALQPLLQWIADISLYLIAAVPNTVGGGFPGASILHDGMAVSMLRQMLVVTYVWGMITPSCLPHLTQASSSTDCLQRLFSLITQLWLRVKDSGGSSVTFDDALINDCCLLSSHLAIPAIDHGMFGNTNYNSSIFVQPMPVKFTYGDIPGYISTSHNRPTVFSADGQPPAEQIKDIVRLIHLGITPPEDVKMCSRCRCYTLADSGANKLATTATGAWDGNWIRQCLCGGMWIAGGKVELGSATSLTGTHNKH